MYSYYFSCDVRKIKENERYTVLDEIEIRHFSDDYFLQVKLREYQTNEIINFNLALLLKTVLIIPQFGDFYERHHSDAFLNTSLRLKIRGSRPYITELEIIDYFKSLVKNTYIYFTFDKILGGDYYNINKPKEEIHLEEHTIYNAHIATL